MTLGRKGRGKRVLSEWTSRTFPSSLSQSSQCHRVTASRHQMNCPAMFEMQNNVCSIMVKCSNVTDFIINSAVTILIGFCQFLNTNICYLYNTVSIKCSVL